MEQLATQCETYHPCCGQSLELACAQQPRGYMPIPRTRDCIPYRGLNDKSSKANREGTSGDLVPMKEGGSHLAYCQTALPTFPVEMIPNFPRHIINPGQVVAQCTDCSSLDNQRSAHSHEEDRVNHVRGVA